MAVGVNRDTPTRESIPNMLAQQASIHLAGSRLKANPDSSAYELVWVAHRVLQQHCHKPVGAAEFYEEIAGRSYLVGLLIASVHKTTPEGAWWKVTSAPIQVPHLSTANQLSKVRVRAYDPVAKKNVVGKAQPRNSSLGGNRSKPPHHP